MSPLVIDNDDNTIVNGEALIRLVLEWVNDNDSFINYLEQYYTAGELYLALAKNPNFKQSVMVEYLEWRLELEEDEAEDIVLCDVQLIF